jgi:hypothetical protein
MNTWPIYALVAMAREANRCVVYHRRHRNSSLALAAVGRRAAYMAQARVAHDNSLARANGWGSAGQCPASGIAKTPAAREQVSRVAGEKDTACASVCGGEVAR